MSSKFLFYLLAGIQDEKFDRRQFCQFLSFDAKLLFSQAILPLAVIFTIYKISVQSEIVTRSKCFLVPFNRQFLQFECCRRVMSQYTCEACGLELQKKKTFPDPQGNS